jgi:phosphoenolpyruvate-protein kinase (PTS system EI component)
MLLNCSAKVPFSGGGEMAGDPMLVPLLLGLSVEALMLSSAQEIYAKCEAFCRARVKLD